MSIGGPKIAREIRTCAHLDCSNTFECRVDNDREFCSIGCSNNSRKVPIEIKFCKCKCGETFECKINGKQRYINGHNRRGKGKNSGSGRKKAPREIRICACGECGETFECKVTSKKMYISGHNRRNKHNSKEHNKKIRESNRTVELWKDPKYKEKQLKAIFKGLKLLPNRPEKFLTELLQELFPNQWKYVGDGRGEDSIVAGKCPDFINTAGQKKIIEMNGDFWHGEERTGRTKEEEEQQRIDCFAQVGYQTLVIWEYELSNIKNLKERILEFTYE